MGLANSFAAIERNRFSRKWGGSKEDTVDPYISGYFFTHWAYLPPKLADAIKYAGGNDGISSNSEVQNILRSSCLSVTLPGATLNKAEFTGLGGVKWSTPTNTDWDNTVTAKFLEFSTLPILSIIHGWTRMIRDYRTGVTLLQGSEGEYSRANYAATAYYWTTKPDGKLVEYYACLTGLYPLKDPTDQYGGDLTTYDKLELDVDFNCDTVWHETWVKDRCQSLSNALSDSDTGVISEYGEKNQPQA